MAGAKKFERPTWLGPTPFNSYHEYTPDNGMIACLAWEAVPWQVRRFCLYDVHTNALNGSRKDLRAMQRFYINLVTMRLDT